MRIDTVAWLSLRPIIDQLSSSGPFEINPQLIISLHNVGYDVAITRIMIPEKGVKVVLLVTDEGGIATTSRVKTIRRKSSKTLKKIQTTQET
jgi:hypothetical protein